MQKIQALQKIILGLELLQTQEECLPDVAAEGEVGKLAFPIYADQAGGLEFFHMMGKRRR